MLKSFFLFQEFSSAYACGAYTKDFSLVIKAKLTIITIVLSGLLLLISN